MRLGKLIAIILVLIYMVGCAGSVKEPVLFVEKPKPRIFTEKDVAFNVVLTEVERPQDVQDRYGPIEISKMDSDEGYRFEDNLISLHLEVGRTTINFRLKNKMEHSIRILWDSAAFVDSDSASQRVIHAGVKYNERNNNQAPSVIVRGTFLNDTIAPCDRIIWGNDKWNQFPIFAVPHLVSAELLSSVLGSNAVAEIMSSYLSTRDVILKEAEKHIGKRIQILLPLEIQGILNDYLFTFEVTDVTIGKGTPIWWEKDKDDDGYDQVRNRSFTPIAGMIVFVSLVFVFVSILASNGGL